MNLNETSIRFIVPTLVKEFLMHFQTKPMLLLASVKQVRATEVVGPERV